MPFSRRTAWDLQSNAYSRRLEALSGAPLLDLSVTDPTRCGLGWEPEQLSEVLAAAARAPHRPHPLGLTAAREAVAAHALRRGRRVDPEALLLTASTSESYAFLFKLLCDPGEAVLCFTPGYPLLEYLAGLEEVRAVSLPLDWADGWSLPRQRVQVALEDAALRVRAVLLVNPGHPTGHFVRPGELDWLMALCARHQVAVISDEVFSDYAVGEDPDRVTSLAGGAWPALTFALSGLSKVAALPQLKVGWLWWGGPPALAAQARQRLEVIADTYLSVSGPSQHAVAPLLERLEPIQQRLRVRLAENRARLEQARLPGACWDVLPSAGGWAAVLRLPRHWEDLEVALSLLEEGVVVQPGHFFDLGPSHLVLSLLPPPAVFTEGVARLARALDRR